MIEKDNKKWLSVHDLEIDDLPEIKTKLLMKDMLAALEEARIKTEKEKTKAEMYLKIAEVIIVVLDSDGNVSLINKKGCEILGCKEKDIVGKSWFENFLPKSVRVETKKVFKKIISGQIEPLEFYENPIINSQGEERLIAWHNALLKDSEGKIYASISSGEDITKERKNENLLQESEEKFRYVFDNSPVGMSLTFLDGRVNTNQALNKMLGYSKTEMRSKKWQDITYPDDIKLTETNISSLKAGKQKIAKFVKRFLHKNGSLVWVELTSFLRRDETGRPLYLISVLVDITKRKQNEQKLQESEKKFAAAFHASPNLMVITQIVDGKILEVNEGYTRLLGYSRAESIGMTTTELSIWANPTDRAVFTASLKKTGRVNNFETKLRCKDGTIVSVIDSARIIKFSDKTCLLSVAYDITDRKKIEDRLKESEKKYSSIVEKTSDAIQILSPQGDVVFVNKSWLKILGYTKEEALKKNVFRDLIDPEMLTECQAKFARLFKGKSLVNFETTFLNRKGVKVFFVGNVVPKIEGEKVVSINCVLHDVTKEKVTEKRLSNNEKRYRITAEKTGQLIYEYRVKTGEIFWAGAIKKNTGYSEKEFAQTDIKKWSEMIHPDDRKRVNSELTEALKKVNKFETQYRFQKKDGGYIDIKDHGIFVKSDKNIITMYGSMEDITKKKVIEEKIKSNEELIRNLNNNLSSVMVYQLIRLKDGSRKFTYLSETVRKFYGISPTQAQKNSKLIYNRVFSDDQERIRKAEEAAYRKMSTFEIEARIVCPGKQIRWFRFISTPTKLKNGVTRWDGVQIDISERVRIINELKESEKKYFNLVENSNDGVLVIQDGKIKLLNEQMAIMGDLERDKAVNLKFLDFVAPESKKMVIDKYLKRIAGFKEDPRYEFDIISSKGKRVSIEVNSSLIDYDSRPAVMAIVRDMTRTKELEKMRNDFVSTASHQLRTPLTGIKWFTELLLNKKAGEVSEKQTDFLQQIHLSNERMIKLVDDLLSVTHIDSVEKFKVLSKKENLIKVLDESVNNLKGLAESKKIKIIKKNNCPTSLSVLADREKISLVFQNLISNAVKYSPEKSTIEIGCDRNKNEVVFYCADHGVGIPKKQQARVFERFFRADNVVTTESGTGLGLYIAKNIVDRHKGRIWFKSTEGKGTTFYVALPKK